MLSVVILTWNSQRHIERCFDALMRELSNMGHEIIVVDNGSADETLPLLARYESVQLIGNRFNRGVAAARNQGIRRARGEYVLLLDVDTVVAPGSLHTLVRFMEDNASVGLCGPKLVTPTGDLQLSCRRFPTLISKVARRAPAKWADDCLFDEELRWWSHDAIVEVDYLIGACQIIRRSLFDVIGLLDEQIFYGPEDIDFCIRVWQHGSRVVYHPEAEVVHLEQRVTRRAGWRSPLWRKHLLALAYYFLKHRYLVSRQSLYNGLGEPARMPVYATKWNE